MLKFNNIDKTSATFDGVTLALASPEDWESIGDTPTREAVLHWLSEGNTPEPADVPDFATLKVTQFAEFNTDRIKFLDALTGIAGRAYRKGDMVTSDACDAVAEGLLVLKDQPEVLAATDLPGLQKAMLYCYAKLLVNVPASVKAVFAKVKS